MYKIFGAYAFVDLGILIFIIISVVFLDKRYRKNHGLNIPEGFEKTEEVTIDPSNGKKFRIYYNPNTGERFYHEEYSDN